MKYCLILTVFVVSLFSCTKPSNPTPASPPTDTASLPPVPDSLLKSYTIYSPGVHILQVQTFSYDKKSQLAALHSYSYDTSTPGSPVIDSFSVVFALTGTATPPPSYDILYQYHWAPPGGLAEHHDLYYDDQNRVVRDSIAGGNNGTNYNSVHFYYDSINTVGQDLGYDTTFNRVILGEVDTFQIQSDNIVYDISYAQPGAMFLHLYTYLYTTDINPLYNQAFANSLGCVMVYDGFADFRSKNLPSQGVQYIGASTRIGLFYSWTTDSLGRVIQGVASDGPPQQIYNFTY